MANNDEKKSLVNKTEKKSVKKAYKKPVLKSEKILEAGLGATCNGTNHGGRKDTTGNGCNAGSLKT